VSVSSTCNQCIVLATPVARVSSACSTSALMAPWSEWKLTLQSLRQTSCRLSLPRFINADRSRRVKNHRFLAAEWGYIWRNQCSRRPFFERFWEESRKSFGGYLNRHMDWN
jgi:hypothetical protein